MIVFRSSRSWTIRQGNISGRRAVIFRLTNIITATVGLIISVRGVVAGDDRACIDAADSGRAAVEDFAGEADSAENPADVESFHVAANHIDTESPAVAGDPGIAADMDQSVDQPDCETQYLDQEYSNSVDTAGSDYQDFETNPVDDDRMDCDPVCIGQAESY